MPIHLEHVRLKVRPQKDDGQRCAKCGADFFYGRTRCPRCADGSVVADRISTIVITSESGGEDIHLYVRDSEMEEFRGALLRDY